jgi:hypothetical protein
MHSRTLAFVFTLFSAAAAVQAQSPYMAGFNAAIGTMEFPYSGGCATDGGASARLQLYGGRDVGNLEVSATYSLMINVAALNEMCVAAPIILPDGDHRVRSYTRSYTDPLHVLGVRAGLVPPALTSLTLYAGAGIQAVEWDPTVLVGASLRTRGLLRVRVGGDLTYSYARYDDVLQRWEGGEPVSFTPLQGGGDWRSGLHLWAGLEVGLPQPKRSR